MASLTGPPIFFGKINKAREGGQVLFRELKVRIGRGKLTGSLPLANGSICASFVPLIRRHFLAL